MSDNLEILNSLIEKSKAKGADLADAIAFETSNTTISTRKEKLENIEKSDSLSFGLRVIIQQKSAIVTANNLKNSGNSKKIDELVDNAIAIAKLAPADKYIGLIDPHELATSYQSTLKELQLVSSENVSHDELFLMANTAENAALSNHMVTNTEGGEAFFNKTNVYLATSNGFSASYDATMLGVSASVIAGRDDDMVRDYEISYARDKKDLMKAELIGQIAAARTVKRLNAKTIKTNTMPVIFDSRTAKSLLATFSGLVNGAAVARGASCLKDAMGDKIFGDDINIINDPYIKKGLGSKPFDAEGVAHEKLNLIENGVLKNWLLDLRSANQLGLRTNGNASRSVSMAPSPAASNLYIENGKVTVAEMLAEAKNGLYVTETFGMGVNAVTGDYSQGAFGFLIENGEITRAVNKITIAANLKDMFKNMVIANDLEFKYSINSPSLLFKEMTVAGE